jgi:endogenous inhibitor of DNA gyrase (YacG/DUF329 family)
MTSLIVKCPTCQRAVAWTADNTFKPFCSERCKLVDLGEWVMEERRIAGEPLLVDGDDQEITFSQ